MSSLGGLLYKNEAWCGLLLPAWQKYFSLKGCNQQARQIASQKSMAAHFAQAGTSERGQDRRLRVASYWRPNTCRFVSVIICVLKKLKPALLIV